MQKNINTDKIISNLKKQLQIVFPDSETFLKYINPYFLRIEEDYNKILIILKKIGVKNGVKGTWGILCDTYRIILTNEDFFQSLVKSFQTRLPEAERAITEGGIESTIKVFTWDSVMLPFVKQLFEAIPEKTRKRIDLLEKKTNTLPQHEQELCKEFNLFVHKLYINYLITHIPSSHYDIYKIFVKIFLLEYYKSENELYGKEVASEKIIHHIKNIHIVGEQKLLQGLPVAEKLTANINSHNPSEKFDLSYKFETPIKPFSPKELSEKYKVTPKTFYSWINPQVEKIGKLSGKRYTPKQVKIIFHILGEP